MIFNASNEFDIQRAKERLEYLIEKKKTFEITEKKPKRTYSQNNYIHLLFAWFALEYGETPEYVKQEMFKKIVNPQIFRTEYANRKTGGLLPPLHSAFSPIAKSLYKEVILYPHLLHAYKFRKTPRLILLPLQH